MLVTGSGKAGKIDHEPIVMAMARQPIQGNELRNMGAQGLNRGAVGLPNGHGMLT
jgi:hypothetical protein